MWGGLHTPCALLPTHYGQAQHISRDLLATLPAAVAAAGVRFPQMAGQVALAEARATGRSATDASLSAYCGLGGRAAVLLLRDPSAAPTPAASDSAITFETPGGRRPTTFAEYSAALLTLRPHAAVSFHDELVPGMGTNRLRASLARSTGWLARCIAGVEGARVTTASTATPSGGESKSEGGVEPPRKAPRMDNETESASVPPAAGSPLPHATTLPPPPPPPGLLAYVPVAVDARVRSRAVADVAAIVAAAASRAAAVGCATPVVGFYFGGLHWGETRDARVAALVDAIASLPAEGVRLLTGAATPLEIIDAVVAGVDVVDSDYAGALTEFGCAASFLCGEEEEGASSAGAAVCGVVGDGGAASAAAPVLVAVASAVGGRPHLLKGTTAARKASAGGFRVANGTAAPTPTPVAGSGEAGDGGSRGSSSGAAARPQPQQAGGDDAAPLFFSPPPEWLVRDAASVAPLTMNLRDPVYAADSRPLVPGCPCFTCSGLGSGGATQPSGPVAGRPAGNVFPPRAVTHSGHSRAYIHHLLNTQEMLGSTLLMLHNVTRVAALTTALREAIIAAGADVAAGGSVGRVGTGVASADATSGAPAALVAAPAARCGALAYREWFVLANRIGVE